MNVRLSSICGALRCADIFLHQIVLLFCCFCSLSFRVFRFFGFYFFFFFLSSASFLTRFISASRSMLLLCFIVVSHVPFLLIGSGKPVGISLLFVYVYFLFSLCSISVCRLSFVICVLCSMELLIYSYQANGKQSDKEHWMKPKMALKQVVVIRLECVFFLSPCLQELRTTWNVQRNKTELNVGK